MNNLNIDYDISDEQSIIEYASKLVGHSLREVTDVKALADHKKRRGAFGNAVEELYFKYPINSDSNPDFAEVGLELKTTPMKENKKGDLVAKERLVITMIDYNKVVNESFEDSHFLEKSSNILLMAYKYEKGANPIDYKVILANKWNIPIEDYAQIKQDWETVVTKIQSCHAEDISGSDTLYLEACTKAANSSIRTTQPYSNVPAKPRAWAFKASYMTTIEKQMLGNGVSQIKRNESEQKLSLIDLLYKRFKPYFGKTEDQLAAEFHISKSKDKCARITKHILGIAEDQKIEEFEKAGIKPKTMRLKSNGVPKESVSFKVFDYFKVAEEPFEESDLYHDLLCKYLFVIYRENSAGDFALSNILLWQMPDFDLLYAEQCYLQMQKNIKAGRADISVKASENICCHVRPHARNKLDTKPQPYGKPEVKKCFWLNSSYLAEEISKGLSLKD